MTDPWLVVAVLACESAWGYPAWVESRIPHPVTWVGNFITAADRRWNIPDRAPGQRKVLGVVTVILAAGSAAVTGGILDAAMAGRWWTLPFWIVLATTGLAQRSLYLHVAAVRDSLRTRDIAAARQAVARIVGRDVQTLDDSEITAATLETLAESFNDGVVAPTFWLMIGGLTGLFAYKAVNTADSMIGHLEPRWRAFGWAAARSDDVMNFIPARIAGGLLAGTVGAGWRVMLHDAHRHASPNAGWPEAAMAGALGISLGGPATYDGVVHPRPTLGDGRKPGLADLERGLQRYVRACSQLWLAFSLGGLAWRL